MRTAIAILMLVSSLAAAHAFGLGKEGKMFGRLGAISNKKTAGGGGGGCSPTGLKFNVACNSQYLTIVH